MEPTHRRGDPCIIEGCGEGAGHTRKGLCQKHYARKLRTGSTELPDRSVKPTCTVEGCSSEAKTKKMCSKHYERTRRGADVLTGRYDGNHLNWRGGRSQRASGYVSVYLPVSHRFYPEMTTRSGHVMQHRLVMAEHLNRPLLPTEEVHHINGVRNDNRIENLELWIKSQPSGIRAKDAVVWAREILARYEGVFDED